MKKISVLCRGGNNPVTEITELLGNHGIDIRDINYQEFGAHAVLTLVPDKIDETLSLLASSDYSALSDDTVLIQVEDKPGVLGQISRGISDLGVDIRSLTLMTIGDNTDVVAVSTTDNDKVRMHYAEQLIN